MFLEVCETTVVQTVPLMLFPGFQIVEKPPRATQLWQFFIVMFLPQAGKGVVPVTSLLFSHRPSVPALLDEHRVMCTPFPPATPEQLVSAFFISSSKAALACVWSSVSPLILKNCTPRTPSK